MAMMTQRPETYKFGLLGGARAGNINNTRLCHPHRLLSLRPVPQGTRILSHSPCPSPTTSHTRDPRSFPVAQGNKPPCAAPTTPACAHAGPSSCSHLTQSLTPSPVHHSLVSLLCSPFVLSTSRPYTHTHTHTHTPTHTHTHTAPTLPFLAAH